MKRKEDYLDY